MRIPAFLSIGILFAGIAYAEPLTYSIPWFEMQTHSGARQEAIRSCRNDHRYYENKETRALCENAEMAESRIYSKRMSQGLNVLNTVEWWKDNRDLRASILEACRRRAPYDRDMLQYCGVAQEADRLVRKNVRG